MFTAIGRSPEQIRMGFPWLLPWFHVLRTWTHFNLALNAGDSFWFTLPTEKPQSEPLYIGRIENKSPDGSTTFPTKLRCLERFVSKIVYPTICAAFGIIICSHENREGGGCKWERWCLLKLTTDGDAEKQSVSLWGWSNNIRRWTNQNSHHNVRS